MAAQESDSDAYATQAELDRLCQRQELILSQLDQLQLRVDTLTSGSESRSHAKGDGISVLTDHGHIGSQSISNLHQHSSSHHKHRSNRMNAKDFAKLNESQDEMLDRLLDVAHNVNRVAQSKNVGLPDQDIVDQSMPAILQMIDRRLSKVISKTEFLISMAKQSNDVKPEMTPDSVRSQGTPVFHSRPRKLSSAGLEPMQILPFHNEPKESESAEFWRRIDELEYSVKHFKEMLYDLSKDNDNSKVTPKDVYNVLSNMNLGLDLQQVMHSRHISIITKEFTNNETNSVDFEKICEMTLDIGKTDRGEHKHEWHHFRRTLIGMERKDGCLRILYRFDGWPYPQTIRLFHRIDTSKNIVLPNDIAHVIHDATKEHVEFEQISYAEKSKHRTGKRVWIKIDKNEPIPLHVERDGWLEVDVWLKTAEFIHHKRGKPLPKYA